MPRRDTPLDGALRFSGAVGASLSHELNNVLAVIGELNGLIIDLVEFRQDGAPIDGDRLTGVAERIEREIDRGRDFVKQLNQFAHRVDGGPRSVDAVENVRTVVSLCTRFARLKKVTITAPEETDAHLMNAHPFDLDHAIYRCITPVLNAAPEGARISTAVASSKTDVHFTFAADRAGELPETLDEMTAALKRDIERYDGRIEFDMQDRRPPRIVMTLPQTLRRASPPPPPEKTP